MATTQPLSTTPLRTPRWWWVAAALAVLVAGYSLRYVVVGERAYVPDLAASFRARPVAIALHAFFGPLALTLGLVQLLPAMRRPQRWGAHRIVGRVYGASAIALALAGLYMAPHSVGGIGTHLGFGLLAAGVLLTTAQGYRSARGRDFTRHREWMLRSYALIFGAVTLRIWLPILIIAYGGHFLPAYQWVAWLSWVPNILWAEWIIRRGWRPAFQLDAAHTFTPGGAPASDRPAARAAPGSRSR
ncbi:MAG: DUF2306 domain-containing protein [Gemmatimonadaceae bacterium]